MKTKEMRNCHKAEPRYWERIPGFNYALGFSDRVYPNTSKSDVQEVCISRYFPDFDE